MPNSNGEVRVTENVDVKLELDGSEKEVNQYRIGALLGEGSFSQVFKCSNKFTGEEYAIKVLSRSFLKKKREFIRTGKGRPKIKTALEDVEREIAFMKKIHHRNLVQLVEVIDDAVGDSIYMVIEYMPQGQIMDWNNDLKSYRDKDNKVLTESRAREVFCDVIQGLSYLHGLEVVHRDLKPENILIDANGQAKIADFGVAQKVIVDDSSQGLLNRSAGTPWFMSPESVIGKEFNGFAFDLWTLGVCLLVFVTGKLPYYSDSEEELYEMISSKPVIIPTDEGLTKDIIRVLEGLLEKDASKRLTMAQLKEDSWVDVKEETVERIEVTDADLETAITVRLNFFMAVKLKMFVRRWKARSQLNRESNLRKDSVKKVASIEKSVEELTVAVEELSLENKNSNNISSKESSTEKEVTTEPALHTPHPPDGPPPPEAENAPKHSPDKCCTII